ncbi:TVP38/TMEM64 family protein [Alkaliphilus peptidifermentans]|uniref:TVP38/TMEM64 family membrane protein n=1 Tax=Alkaliphilus peptidifermentans DSM 18978 TaxID=1120976 RepID=A0A1G5AS18_9FIRM|nr:TVP38/TMEM64 family protein [Alkaliphilus peptidifermentans]SCX80688.1 Uncharacterized membrane protein YdjX, TVP38/TMEM64 family, SNARE-associated domain [Alkaliphilus peptidifermentans DSM 18978]
MKKNTIKSLIIISLVILFIYIAISYYEVLQEHVSIEKIQELVGTLGMLGGLAYIIIASIRPFIFIPSPFFFVMGGILFGVIKGSIYNIIGLLIGASLCYLLSNRFKNAVVSITGDRYLKKLKQVKEEDAIKTLFSMRVTPGFPFDPVSYAAGIAGISYKNFIAGSFLGSTPKIFLYTLLGDGVDDFLSIQTILVFLILIALACVPVIIKKKHSTCA